MSSECLFSFKPKVFYFNWLLQIIDWLDVNTAAARLANSQNFTESHNVGKVFQQLFFCCHIDRLFE